MTGSPTQDHYLKNQSDKRYAAGLFAKKSQNTASYGSQGDTANVKESQRGFVPLSEQSSQSKTFTARVEQRVFSPDTDSGRDFEMQRIRGAHKGIHVRNDMSVDYLDQGA